MNEEKKGQIGERENQRINEMKGRYECKEREKMDR